MWDSPSSKLFFQHKAREPENNIFSVLSGRVNFAADAPWLKWHSKYLQGGGIWGVMLHSPWLWFILYYKLALCKQTALEEALEASTWHHGLHVLTVSLISHLHADSAANELYPVTEVKFAPGSFLLLWGQKMSLSSNDFQILLFSPHTPS